MLLHLLMQLAMLLLPAFSLQLVLLLLQLALLLVLSLHLLHAEEYSQAAHLPAPPLHLRRTGIPRR